MKGHHALIFIQQGIYFHSTRYCARHCKSIQGKERTYLHEAVERNGTTVSRYLLAEIHFFFFYHHPLVHSKIQRGWGVYVNGHAALLVGSAQRFWGERRLLKQHRHNSSTLQLQSNTRRRPWWPLCCHRGNAIFLPLWKQVGGLRWNASLYMWFYWKTEPHELEVKPCKCWSLPICPSGKYPENPGSRKGFLNLIPLQPQNSL